ncbi:MAG: TIGR03936 family radical SAM-associated protein [Chloroflexota bacterium]|jgi:radical SAM-linked protein
MQANYVQRLRLQFAKVGPTRFIGHLDLAKALERSLNRAQIPLAYTQGYNPRPRMQLAAALPLGFTSECELADIWLLEVVDPGSACKAMAPKMAPGIELRMVSQVDLSEPALQNLVQEAAYLATIGSSPGPRAMADVIDQFLSATSIIRERRGKNYDLRPLVHELALVKPPEALRSGEAPISDELVLSMRLSMLPGKTGRPDEVLDALGLDALDARIHRQRLILAH